MAVWPPVVAASRPTARQRASDGTRPRPVSPRPPLVGSGVAVGHNLNLPRLTPGLGERAGSLETFGFKQTFWSLLGLRPKVTRAGARNVLLDNPSVNASRCHLPLHKGGESSAPAGAGMRIAASLRSSQ